MLWYNIVKQGVLDAGWCELLTASGQFSKKKKEPVEMINRHFQLFSGEFVWGVLQLYEGVLIGKLVAYK